MKRDSDDSPRTSKNTSEKVRQATVLERRDRTGKPHRENPMPEPQPPLLDRVRDCIRAANRRGVTAYALSMKAGVARSQISRLMRRKNSLLVPTAEAIVKAAGYEIVLVRQRTREECIDAIRDSGRLSPIEALRLKGAKIPLSEEEVKP